MVEQNTQRYDATFSALGNPTRRALLAQLTKGTATVNEPSPPGWADTNLTWEIGTDDHGHTVVRFGHNGWVNTEGGYASVNYNWGFFLTSLKMYIETGTGTPNVYGG